MNAYDRDNDMMKISSMQKKFRDSFSGAALDTTKWTLTQGAGMTVTVAAGELSVAGGTTINSETIIESNDSYTVPCKMLGAFQYAPIANQELYIELVSVDSKTKIVDGKFCASWLVDSGCVAAQAKYQVQTGGLARLTSAASAITSLASYSMLEIEIFGDECWFHSRIMDSNAGRSNSYVRHQQIPDPNQFYKIRLRVKNLATAPAANTFKSTFVVVNDYAELTAEITAGRGNIVAGQAMGVAVVSMPTTTVTGTVTTSPTAPTAHVLTSAATTNATSVKVTAGTIFSTVISNLSASPRYVKIYNKASAPTVGTDIPIIVIPIAATSIIDVEYGSMGLRLSTGIAYAITGAIADTDTTAIAAGDVKVAMSYI